MATWLVWMGVSFGFGWIVGLGYGPTLIRAAWWPFRKSAAAQTAS